LTEIIAHSAKEILAAAVQAEAAWAGQRGAGPMPERRGYPDGHSKCRAD
jgi:hypothetical protein